MKGKGQLADNKTCENSVHFKNTLVNLDSCCNSTSCFSWLSSMPILVFEGMSVYQMNRYQTYHWGFISISWWGQFQERFMLRTPESLQNCCGWAICSCAAALSGNRNAQYWRTASIFSMNSSLSSSVFQSYLSESKFILHGFGQSNEPWWKVKIVFVHSHF